MQITPVLYALMLSMSSVPFRIFSCPQQWTRFITDGVLTFSIWMLKSSFKSFFGMTCFHSQSTFALCIIGSLMQKKTKEMLLQISLVNFGGYLKCAPQTCYSKQDVSDQRMRC